jgi:NAD(P)-dependent dehydrogenase (short-subunit alcohol dehydrogenase family)
MATETAFPPQQQGRQPGMETEMNPKPEIIRDSYRGSGKLEGKVALITGGDSGIGRSIAVHFAREGAEVAIVYKPEEQADANDTKGLLEAEGKQCLLLAGDLQDSNFCREVVEKTVQHFGKLNILVNNAAEQHVEQSLEDISEENLLSTFSTNIFPQFIVTKAALKHLKKGDSIINTASINAYTGNPQLMDYSSTKGAIVSFTRSLAASLVEKGIRVNGVAPGAVWTPLIPATFPPEKVSEFGKQAPMKRAAQPCEIAPSFVFLASEDASYFTGQFLHPDGGRYMSS